MARNINVENGLVNIDGVVMSNEYQLDNYRSQAIVPVVNKTKGSIEIFDVTDIVDSNEKCPFCYRAYTSNAFNKLFNERATICSPKNKYYLPGYLWWKKYCKIDGIHGHLICKECNYHLIRMIDNKIDSSIIKKINF